MREPKWRLWATKLCRGILLTSSRRTRRILECAQRPTLGRDHPGTNSGQRAPIYRASVHRYDKPASALIVLPVLVTVPPRKASVPPLLASSVPPAALRMPEVSSTAPPFALIVPPELLRLPARFKVPPVLASNVPVFDAPALLGSNSNSFPKAEVALITPVFVSAGWPSPMFPEPLMVSEFVKTLVDELPKREVRHAITNRHDLRSSQARLPPPRRVLQALQFLEAAPDAAELKTASSFCDLLGVTV